jgi:hypothetical protein
VTAPGPGRLATPAEIAAIEKQAARTLAGLDLYIRTVSAWLAASPLGPAETVTVKDDLL